MDHRKLSLSERIKTKPRNTMPTLKPKNTISPIQSHTTARPRLSVNTSA